jgi:opacity protein-like surface antigen
MRTAFTVYLGALLLAFTPSIASAQKKVHVNIGGGPTFIADDLGDHFGTGWGPAVGVTFDATSNVSFQFEYAYRYFDIKDDAPFFGATRFSANHQTHQLDFNLVLGAPAGSTIRPYAIVGPGMYNRKVEITEYVGNGIICDPYWYVCGAYPITGVVGSRGGWDFGFNVGGGVGFGIGETAEFYVEMRYHKVWGPEITSNVPGATGTGGNADGTYYPLTFGLRF